MNALKRLEKVALRAHTEAFLIDICGLAFNVANKKLWFG
jgi:hypothetical protein